MAAMSARMASRSVKGRRVPGSRGAAVEAGMEVIGNGAWGKNRCNAGCVPVAMHRIMLRAGRGLVYSADGFAPH
ncbi:hypothetical protein CBM2613_A330053 [Cupriavidus taiwanensis]|uniref:Uncharacterized protein n=1 Tax=Cupriavidus taiwanensis TaxID=164546 RepID=A0A976AXT6_9BURK|nr:hypothetical protein CBM2613_A330053 [Cupriavidus taiwanensis]